jgi:hypothetical protein
MYVGRVFHMSKAAMQVLVLLSLSISVYTDALPSRCTEQNGECVQQANVVAQAQDVIPGSSITSSSSLISINHGVKILQRLENATTTDKVNDADENSSWVDYSSSSWVDYSSSSWVDYSSSSWGNYYSSSSWGDYYSSSSWGDYYSSSSWGDYYSSSSWGDYSSSSWYYYDHDDWCGHSWSDYSWSYYYSSWEDDSWSYYYSSWEDYSWEHESGMAHYYELWMHYCAPYCDGDFIYKNWREYYYEDDAAYEQLHKPVPEEGVPKAWYESPSGTWYYSSPFDPTDVNYTAVWWYSSGIWYYNGYGDNHALLQANVSMTSDEHVDEKSDNMNRDVGTQTGIRTGIHGVAGGIDSTE